MREMGIEGISAGPNLSKRTQKEGIFPYLLRHMSSQYPNHIWGWISPIFALRKTTKTFSLWSILDCSILFVGTETAKKNGT
jgi:hypothetical protein